MNNEIVILSGMSGVGKDTLATLLSERDGYNFVISTTTRPMRESETEGNPYHFVTKEEFFKRDMIEKREYKTLVGGKEDIWYYGVEVNAIKDDKKYVVVLDVSGTIDFIRNFGNRAMPIMLEMPEEVRKQRSIARGNHDESEWNRREKADGLVFLDKMSTSFLYKAYIHNENIEDAYNNALTVIEKSKERGE